jgi:hypothetical protein
MQLFSPRRSTRVDLITQHSRTRYLDEVKLRRLLVGLFGEGNFRMRVSPLHARERVDEADEELSCRTMNGYWKFPVN